MGTLGTRNQTRQEARKVAALLHLKLNTQLNSEIKDKAKAYVEEVEVKRKKESMNGMERVKSL